MEIAFHCPNCLADLIYDESKKYTCCFCHTVLGPRDEVRELEGGYYVGDAWNEKVYHSFHCETCGSDFIAKAAGKHECPLCSDTNVKDNGEMIGAMPRRAIPFTQTKAQAEEIFLDYIRNNSAVGRTLATEENSALLHKVYVPIWSFTYEVLAYARLTAMLRNKANDNHTVIMGIDVSESLAPIRSSLSRFRQNFKGNAAKEAQEQPSEHTTGGVLSWQGIPFDASGLIKDSTINALQPYDQSKMTKLNDKMLQDAAVLAITKDPITSMQEFMERIKKWTRQMIMDAHSDSYDIAYFQDRTDYPLGIGELVLYPIWYMKGEYMGREFYFAMNGQNGEIEANIPMAKQSAKKNTITYQQYWDKERCTAMQDTHFEFNIKDPNIEILDYSFFEKPKNSRVSADGSSKLPEKEDSGLEPLPPLPDGNKEIFSARPSLDPAVEAFRKRDPNKKLTKEEEQQRAREMTARLRVAAKEAPKGDMSAAAEAPSWARAVTPPPSAAAGSRQPARTKKPALDRPSVASSGNKPLWERTEEDEQITQPKSMAERIAMGNQEIPAQNAPDQLPPMGMAPMGMSPLGGMNRSSEAEPEVALPDLDTRNDVMVNQAGMDLNSAFEAMIRRTQREEPKEAEAYEVQVKNPDSLDSLDAYEVPMPKFEPTMPPIPQYDGFEPQPDPVDDFELPEGEEVEIFKKAVSEPVEEKAEAPEVKKEPQVEEAALPEIKEPSEGEDEEMMANITFSFAKKKKPAFSGEPTMSGTPIPRRPEKAPEAERGMAIMNSEYDSGVLPGSTLNHEEIDSEAREVVPKANASENYFGSDKNDRPLAFRPAAPLAQKRGDVYVEEVEHHPELDENNRPVATRPLSPLARGTESMPNLEYLAENHLDDDIHQIPSIAKQHKWGEMPEATETPSWAKPSGGSTSRGGSPFRGNNADSPRERVRRPSREELMEQDRERNEEASARTGIPRPSASRPGASRPAMAGRAEEEPANRPAYRSAIQQPSGLASRQEEPEEETRPINSAFRPARRPAEDDAPRSGRPGSRTASERPAASSMKQKANENVPIWERQPENDGPLTPWGTPMTAYQDERPRGSLMKPEGQVIDVEKPREKPSLWRPDGSAKEVLPGGHAQEREVSVPRREPPRSIREEGGAAPRREPPRSIREEGGAAPRREPPRSVRSIREEEASRRHSGVEVEVGASRRPASQPAPSQEAPRRSAFDAAPSQEEPARPRTYAQRLQMEEEERRREIQSPFAPAERPASRPGSPFASRPVEKEPVKRSYDPSQFEDKPAVVSTLDQLPEPLDDASIHHLAKDDSVPPLAFGINPIREELADGERRAQRAMRDLPDYDPDGPSPFK